MNDNFVHPATSRISITRDGHSITRSAKIPKPVVLVDTREQQALPSIKKPPQLDQRGETCGLEDG